MSKPRWPPLDVEILTSPNNGRPTSERCLVYCRRYLFISINVFCWRTASTNQITNLTLPAMKIFFHYTPLELLIGLKIIRVYETAKGKLTLVISRKSTPKV